MADLQLMRTPGDRRFYARGRVGTLRLQSFASRTATVEAGGARWRISRRGLSQRRIEATDEAAVTVG